MTASVLSPTILPRNIVKRETGETSTSLRKPKSLSQITEMPINMAVKRVFGRLCLEKATAGKLNPGTNLTWRLNPDEHDKPEKWLEETADNPGAVAQVTFDFSQPQSVETAQLGHLLSSAE